MLSIAVTIEYRDHRFRIAVASGARTTAASAAALNPYAAAAGIRPGYPPSAAAAAELQALQQYKDMMTRAAMGAGSLPPQSAASQAAQAAAAASNPYAALYGLMGYPGAGGFPGPAGGRKDS